MRIVAVLCLFFLYAEGFSQQHYFIQFTEKENTSFFLENPEIYLSPKALARREVQQVALDSLDVPVSEVFVDSISKYNVVYRAASKWQNGIVLSANIQTIDSIVAIDFVSKIECLDCGSAFRIKNTQQSEGSFSTSEAGNLDLGIPYAQSLGLNGNGILSACFDAGFEGVDQWQGDISFEYDFLNYSKLLPNNQDDHGTAALSRMIGQLGPADEGRYFLFNTEIIATESRLEEYNWLLAAEKADSIGVDFISSSLGYNYFDNSNYDYTYSDFGTEKSIVSYAAKTASLKGIIVVNSIGNEGNSPWLHSVFPADVEEVVTVGAVDQYGTVTNFSSVGYNKAPNVKPDVMALGKNVEVLNPAGEVVTLNGTSFSCPQITAFLMLLKEQFPTKSNAELKAALFYSCDRYPNKNYEYGYGIPDFERASKYLEDPFFEFPEEAFILNPSKNTQLQFSVGGIEEEVLVEVTIGNVMGGIEGRYSLLAAKGFTTLNLQKTLPTGIYLVQLKFLDRVVKSKVLFIP